MSLGDIITFNSRRCTKVRRDGSVTSAPASSISSISGTFSLSSPVPVPSDDTTPFPTPDSTEVSSVSPSIAVPTTSDVVTMSTQSTSDSNDGNMHPGMKITIISATVTSVVAVIILLSMFVCLRRRNRRQLRARQQMSRPLQTAQKSSHTRAYSAPISFCASRYSASTTSDLDRDGVSDRIGNQSTRNLVEAPRPILQRPSLSPPYIPGAGISVDRHPSTTLPESPVEIRSLHPNDDTVHTPRSKGRFSRHFNIRGRLHTQQQQQQQQQHQPSRAPAESSTTPTPRASHQRMYSVNSMVPSPSLHFPSDLHLSGSSDRMASPLSVEHTNSWDIVDHNGTASSVVILPGTTSTDGSTTSAHPPLRLTASDLSRWRRSRARSKTGSSSSASRKSDPFDLEESISTPRSGGGGGGGLGDNDEPGYEQHDNDGNYFSDDADREGEAVPCPNGVGVAVAVSLSRPRHDWGRVG